MKKTFFIALFLLVLVFGLTACSGADTSINDGDDSMPADSSSQDLEDNSDVIDDQTTKTTSIENMLDAQKPVHCTYEGSSQEGYASQEVYVYEDKFAAYTTVETENLTQDSLFINDAERIYIWGTSMDVGMMMTKEFMDEQGQESSMDLTQEYDYLCSPWTPSQDSFEPPSDIEFMDMDKFFSDSEGVSTE
ncbi:MAG: hypothetical protein ACOCQQ_01140 [Candidatus Nanoarchaeia archaeon]